MVFVVCTLYHIWQPTIDILYGNSSFLPVCNGNQSGGRPLRNYWYRVSLRLDSLDSSCYHWWIILHTRNIRSSRRNGPWIDRYGKKNCPRTDTFMLKKFTESFFCCDPRPTHYPCINRLQASTFAESSLKVFSWSSTIDVRILWTGSSESDSCIILLEPLFCWTLQHFHARCV